MELSLLTVMTTGPINYSSEHFSSLIICLSSINFFSSFSTLSIRCMDTLLPLCCVGLKYCLNVDFAIWFFDFPKREHRCGKFLKILCVIYCCSVLMKFVIFSPFFVCDSCIPSFWSIILPSRFTLLCGTTSISQFGAAVFPDDKSILRVLFILILLLLKHLNSATFVALFLMFFPSLFVNQFAVVCETKLLWLPVSTSRCILHFPEWVSTQYSHLDLIYFVNFVCDHFHCTRLTVFQSSIFSLM